MIDSKEPATIAGSSLEDELEARLIEDDFNLRIAKIRAEFDFWSMLLDKVTNPTKYPGSMLGLQRMDLRQIKDMVGSYRIILAQVLEKKEISKRNGYRLPADVEDEQDPLK